MKTRVMCRSSHERTHATTSGSFSTPLQVLQCIAASHDNTFRSNL